MPKVFRIAWKGLFVGPKGFAIDWKIEGEVSVPGAVATVSGGPVQFLKVPPDPVATAPVRVLPAGLTVMLSPARSVTLSVRPLRVLTTCPEATFAEVTALSANLPVTMAPSATPKGELDVPVPVRVPS